MIEYGIFNDEGFLEGDIYAFVDAEKALGKWQAAEERHAYIAKVCEEHREQDADYCEECESLFCESCGTDLLVDDDDEESLCEDCKGMED